jgi:hypothetical protein
LKIKTGILIIGIGSTLLTDSTSPLEAIELLQHKGRLDRVSLTTLPAGGLELAGYSRAIISAGLLWAQKHEDLAMPTMACKTKAVSTAQISAVDLHGTGFFKPGHVLLQASSTTIDDIYAAGVHGDENCITCTPVLYFLLKIPFNSIAFGFYAVFSEIVEHCPYGF